MGIGTKAYIYSLNFFLNSICHVSPANGRERWLGRGAINIFGGQN